MAHWRWDGSLEIGLLIGDGIGSLKMRWTDSLEMDFLIHCGWADGDGMANLRWDGSLEMG